MARRSTEERLVVAVDFGTTFSGIAFAMSGTEEPIKAVDVVTIWPGANAITSDKVPSELSYTVDNILDERDCHASISLHTESQPTPFRWGFEVHSGEARLRCIKLLLDARQKLPSFVSGIDTYDMLLRFDKHAKDVVEDYLTALCRHTIETLTSRYGSVFVNTTELDFVLTVPAVWSDAAKAATLKAALKAGMSSIRLVSEPEAAAAHTLQAIQPNHLREGNNFIVCDAEGGTVDLISFEIKQLNPLRLQESVCGSGGMCGSAFLNIRFEQCISAKMGDDAFTAMKQHPRGSRSWQIALAYFEEKVKRRFDDDGRTSFNIPLPGIPDDPNAGIDFGFLTLTNAEVKDIFEPVVTEVIALVEDQMNRLLACGKSVNGILLVGGFGQSSYVAKRLKQQFPGDPPPYSETNIPLPIKASTFEIMQPPNAWTAVVRGAVLLGVEVKDLVLYRMSRRHYGIKCVEPFDPQRHPEACRYFDSLEGIDYARECLQWFIHKDQQVSSGQPALFGFFTKRSSIDDTDPVSQTITLCVCDSIEAPQGRHSIADRSAVRTLCKLNVDLSSVPRHLWVPKLHHVKHYRLDFKIGMRMEGGGLRFDLRVRGVVYGDMVADFE